jgi:hypothetical protein
MTSVTALEFAKRRARPVAKLIDGPDLKSIVPKGARRFESDRGHQPDGRSSNGRTAHFDCANCGSSPRLPATFDTYQHLNQRMFLTPVLAINGLRNALSSEFLLFKRQVWAKKPRHHRRPTPNILSPDDQQSYSDTGDKRRNRINQRQTQHPLICLRHHAHSDKGAMLGPSS